MSKKLAPLTSEQRALALDHANKMLAARRLYAQRVRKNSYDEWGNDKCISRTIDTIRAMEHDRASDRQYRYWLDH